MEKMISTEADGVSVKIFKEKIAKNSLLGIL